MVTIDYNVCNLCGGAKEKRCERICPGDLITMGVDGRPLVRPVEDCWGCTACVKECPVAAISLRLPAQVQPSGPSLKASVKGKDTLWTLTDAHGNKEEFVMEVVRDTRERSGL